MRSSFILRGWPKLAMVLVAAGCAPALEGTAFVPNAGEGTLSVLDLRRLSVSATVKLGERAAHGVAITPDGRFVYAAEMDTGRVFRLDGDAGWAIGRTIETGRRAHGVDLTPDGRFLYVSASRATGAMPGDAVTVVDAETGGVLAVVETDSPAHLTAAPGSERVYVTNLLTHRVSSLRVPGHTIERVAEVGGAFAEGQVGPNEVAVSPDGAEVWSADYDSDTVTIFNRDLEVLEVLSIAGKPHGIGFTPDGREVWIAPGKRGECVVVDARSRQQLATVPVNAEMTNHITFTPDGRTALVSTDGRVVLVDVRARRLVGEIEVGDGPHEIALRR
jgi:DNA-binding beta-propeller fold protein YncE